MPAKINLKVLDLSHHNTGPNGGPVNFVNIKKAGIVGVILKATEGTGMIDKTYTARTTAARAAGLLVGAYHFCSGEDVKHQVDHFFMVANPANDTLMALDFEDRAKSNMSLDQCRDFLLYADAKLGRKLKLYSGNRVKDLLGSRKDALLGGHKLWLAQYGPNPRAQASWDKQWLWQFSGDGIDPGPHSVPGVGGLLDLNSYDGTDAQLAKEWP